MRYSLIALFVFIASNLIADTPESITFSYINETNGLPDNNVNCIFKDSEGFVWFGTRNGLCRFDGYEIKVFRNTEDPNSISGNRILDIGEDTKGNLWIGTYKDGLNRYDKEKERFFRYSIDAGIGERINRVKVLSDGSIWICSNNGLATYNHAKDSFKLYLPELNSENSINTYFVHDILETKAGEIYVAPESSIVQKLDPKTGLFENIFYKRHPELLSNFRKRLLEDQNGTIWIAANYHGLCSYQPQTGESEIYTAFNNNLSTNILLGTMDIDAEGNIWISTEEEGINIFNVSTKTFSHVKRVENKAGSLSSDHIYSIYFDDNNIAWIGTFDKGINIYNPQQNKFSSTLFSVNDLDVLKDFSVLDIFEDEKQRVWVGTDGFGLFRFEKGKPVKHYIIDPNTTNNILTSNVVTSLAQDPQGNILIGTYAGGFISLNPETSRFEHFFPDWQKENSLSSANVWEIFKDSRDRIWLGLLGTGVDKYFSDNNTFKNYGPNARVDNKIDFNNVMVIDEDSDGDVWFGTEGKGLYIMDNQTNKTIRITGDSLQKFTSQGIIKCIKSDRWGQIWIGTEDKGLFCYNKRTKAFRKFANNEGFNSNSVQSLEEDIYGNIWIGTTTGLYKFNNNTQKFNLFILDDGLSSNDFNPDAMEKLSDGRILAGTKNGIDIISVDNIKINQNLPKIMFTRLTVLNKEIKAGDKIDGREILNKSISFTKELKLTWKDKVFLIDFAALNYTLPHKCKYKYKLEGFDKDWIFTDSKRRFAGYSNLNPGDYSLKVRASNNDGKWGDNEVTMKIHIKPPFWNTLLFKIFLFALTFLLIFLLYRRRINIHKEQFKKKQLEQEAKISALEKENLEAELKKLAFSVISKNKLLIEQKNKILNLSIKAKPNVKEGLIKIVDLIDEDLDEEKDFKFIEPQIDKAYNQFITNLRKKHPDLSATEIRIAAYIRMNLTTKEICEFMNKTQRAVENDRYRLRKKIGLESNDSLSNYLISI